MMMIIIITIVAAEVVLGEVVLVSNRKLCSSIPIALQPQSPFYLLSFFSAYTCGRTDCLLDADWLLHFGSPRAIIIVVVCAAARFETFETHQQMNKFAIGDSNRKICLFDSCAPIPRVDPCFSQWQSALCKYGDPSTLGVKVETADLELCSRCVASQTYIGMVTSKLFLKAKLS